MSVDDRHVDWTGSLLDSPSAFLPFRVHFQVEEVVLQVITNVIRTVPNSLEKWLVVGRTAPLGGIDLNQVCVGPYIPLFHQLLVAFQNDIGLDRSDEDCEQYCDEAEENPHANAEAYATKPWVLVYGPVDFGWSLFLLRQSSPQVVFFVR